MNNDLTVCDPSKEDSFISVQQGVYDKPVEIWRNGQLIPGFISQLRIRDAFHKIGDESGQWFIVLEPVKRVPAPRFSHDQNPSFVFGGLELMQASPIKDSQPALEFKKSTSVVKTPSSSSSDYDIIDVEVTVVSKTKLLK